MGERIRLGLIFSVDEGWIGGTYYILNLISALGTLPADRQPIIIILSKNRSDFAAAQNTGYPFLEYHNPFDYKRNFAEAALNKLLKFFLRKDVIDKRISAKKVAVLFPANNNLCFQRVQHKIYWFPDFQHIFYPDFFKANELQTRNEVLNYIAGGPHSLVLSSQAARRDWESLKLSKDCTVHVIPFAVTHPAINDIKIEELLQEFQIEKDYFLVSNQFWKHKNHLVVIKAAAALKKEGLNVQFVFTGKEDDYRNPGYYQSLLDYIHDHDLTGAIKLLGLIDRRKQLKLMQHAKAVIQSSLFEGWSTVIEDAKSLGKNVIASDILVHREQLGIEGLFFDPHNENQLAENIKAFIPCVNPLIASDYKNAVRVFGESFFKLITELN